jgi:hypothetical protein
MAQLSPSHGDHPAGDDSGGIIVGWLSKLAVVLALCGLVLFDCISIASTAVTVSDEGAYAARQASENWQQSKNIQQAYDAAVAAAKDSNPANRVATKSFTVDPDGTVHLTVSRTARTLFVFRLDRTKKWAHVVREAQGRSVAG